MISNMQIKTYRDRAAMSRAAARHAAGSLQDSIATRGAARIIAATGASQFEFLDALTAEPGIDWTAVEMFHLDEYVGLPGTHPASFRRYLRERLIGKTGITRYHLLDGEHHAERVADEMGCVLASAPIDVAFVGIGENTHIAFNDPPADFDTERPYVIVTLDDACRQQQVGEGWFASLAEVPTKAISMSVRQLMKAKEIIAVVPDARKAEAVKRSLEDEISPLTPASILRMHGKATLYLDRDSAALLSPEARGVLHDD